MQNHKLPLEQTGTFSPLFLDFIHRDKKLESFYSYYPDLSGFKSAVSSRKFPEKFRKILADTLEAQYDGLETDARVSENIATLRKANTFTVTTGHQLNIFTGPLYVIYKIISTITLAKKLSQHFPEYHFVPVYWMGSEDHDFEEISIAHVGDLDIKWNTDQTGATGRFSPKELVKLAEKIPGNPETFRQAYGNNETLADAVRYYMNALFMEQGLVVIDPDHKALKELFMPVMEDDLLNHNAEKLVNECSGNLNDLGYQTQVTPREINFFYIEEGLRERVIRKGSQYNINNTSKSFTREEILAELYASPEKFSPNVIMRPVYQEVILPNIAYLGGPSEVAYWLQYKSMFDHAEVPFPVIMPRNFSAFLDGPVSRKFEKTGLEVSKLFQSEDELEKNIVIQLTGNEVLLEEQKESLSEIMKSIRESATRIDVTLKQMVEAETAKMQKHIDRVEKKMIRAEKRKKDDKLGQVRAVHKALFPNGNLQERYANLLTYYFDYPELLEFWISAFDPLDFRFNLIISDD